jgi:hypothetical protein
MGPYESISYMCDTLLEKKDMGRKERFKNYNLIRNASIFAQIKI